MIKILCSKCKSDDIWNKSGDKDVTICTCDNCGNEFNVNISDDFLEFDIY